MRKTIKFAILLGLPLSHGHCQPAFDVASITPCKPGTPEPIEYHTGTVRFLYPGGRFHANATTVQYLLEWAYGILPAQHSGGPSWMNEDRYDIDAKAEGPATAEQVRQMAQTLLAGRFKLKFHRETKDSPVLVVALGKTHPHIAPAKEGEEPSIEITPKPGPSFHAVATRYSITQLTTTFSRHLNRIILDRTGLGGEYDFTFDLTPDESSPNPLDPSVVISALRDQLGLSVKSQKEPIDFLVIESLEKVPAGNQ